MNLDYYGLYMEDYYINALREMKKYQESNNDIDDSKYYMEKIISPSFLEKVAKDKGITGSDEDMEFILRDNEEIKNEVYKINYYFRDHLQIPNISSVLAKRKTQDTIIEFTGRFMDEHEKQLSTAGPVYMFTFGEKEVSILYELFNTNADKIFEMYDNMVQETYYGKIAKFITGWIKNAPHKILITSILIEAIQKGYNDIIECCEYLWAFSEYPILYREFWKTGVKEDVMNYTIEHLGSKFMIKKVSSLQALLKYDAHSSVMSVLDKLKGGADNAYIDLIYRMRNQIKNKFKNISREYYKNIDNNASQHNKDAMFDDGSLADQEGYTTNLTRIIDNTISKFVSGGLNNSMIKISAEASQVDKNILTGFINQINASKENRIPKIIEDIITAYFSKNPTETSIGVEFLNFGMALYRSIGSSKDPIYQEIRSILDDWVYRIINIRQFYTREGTIIGYTRAIFNYVVLMINHYN